MILQSYIYTEKRIKFESEIEFEFESSDSNFKDSNF